MKAATTRARRAAFLLPFLVLAGCAPYAARMEPVLQALAREDYSAAVTALDKKAAPDNPLWLAERGLLLRYAGRLGESNTSFAAALNRYEDLYTRSVSNEAFSLVVNDAVRPYRFRDYELPFLHLYPILNYLELGDQEGAQVEARALSQALELRRSEADGAAADWGLGRLMSALVFESTGEWNDAWIAYGAARAAYGGEQDRAAGGTTADSAAVAVPDAALDSALDSTADSARSSYRPICRAAEEGMARCGLRLGMSAGESRVSDSLYAAVASSSPTNPSRLIVFLEEGFIPPTLETHLQVPILKEEKDWGQDRLEGWSRSVGERALEERRHSWNHPELEVAYFLDIALPVLAAPAEGPFAYTATLRFLDGSPTDSSGTAAATAQDDSHPSPARKAEILSCLLPAEDLSGLARKDLDRRYPAIAGRAAARAILKALATRAADKSSGEFAGKLANLLGVATESADTRGWSSLPQRIGVAVVDVPSGGEAEVVRGAVRIEGSGSFPHPEAGGEVDLPPGSWHFFSCRLFH